MIMNADTQDYSISSLLLHNLTIRIVLIW